jgi:predicted aminopeptidase
MSRIKRLREEYSKPRSGWQGAGRDQANIDRWSDRAAENSKLAPRASNGEMKLPDTGKRQESRSTKSAPRTNAEIDKRMAGENDVNHEGDSAYLRGIRRNA